MDDWKFEGMLRRFSQHELWVGETTNKAKYVNEPGQLWFSYPRSLAVGIGGAEGEIPDINLDPDLYCDAMARFSKLTEAEARASKERLLKSDTKLILSAADYMARLSGISCWHENSEESEDMWALVEEDDGVAIRSTCNEVTVALQGAHNSPVHKAKPSVCAVGYVDHSTYFLPIDGFRNLLSLVKRSHSIENEVRFVAKSPRLASINMTIQSRPFEHRDLEAAISGPSKQEIASKAAQVVAECRDAFKESCRQEEKGFYLPLNIKQCIKEIVLAPSCTSTYEEKVRVQLSKAGINDVGVRHSTFRIG